MVVRSCLLLLVLLTMPGIVAGKAGDAPAATEFVPIGAGQPFAVEVITETLIDSTGFLWIGTRDGLFLHNGQEFRKFQHELHDPASLTSNGIRGILEDSRGRLWINTISGGLNRLDRGNWRFSGWRHDRNDAASISHDGVFALAEAPQGKLWVGTQAGLDLFDPDNGHAEHLVLATGGEFVMDLHVAPDGRLWVATLGQGLFRQNDDGHGFTPIRGGREPAPLDVFTLTHDRDGTLWVGTRVGLYRVDAAKLQIVPSGLEPPSEAPSPQNVTALHSTPTGGLWVGTFGSGLFWVEPQATRLARVDLGPRGPGALHIDTGALALDRDGSLIVGTFGAGLMRASTRIADPRVWRAQDEAGPGLTNEDVYALLPDGTGGMLVGSFGGGVDEIGLTSGVVTHKPLPVPASEQRHLSGVTDLMRTADGWLWATCNEGVYRWREATGEFRYYDSADATSSGFPGYSFALLQDHAGRTWIGGAGDGLYLHQPDSDSFRNFRPGANQPQSLSDDFVTDMIEDREGRLWIGTRSGGVNVCRYDQDLVCRHVTARKGAQDLGHDHVTALLEAPDGAVWVGTAGGGLNHVVLGADDVVRSVRHWTRDDGLPDDNVMALVYAPDGALWLSSHAGLSRLELIADRLDHFTPTDGLPTASFNPKAAVALGDRLYFGSAKGVVSLPHRQPRREISAPPTVIERVIGLDPNELASIPAWQMSTLREPWRKPFSLEFAVLGFDGGATRFQYRLTDSAPWIDLGDRGLLTLHALEPGHYQLQVRGRKVGQGWTLAKPLELVIVPPWWRRNDVRIGAATLGILLLLGFFAWRMGELQERHRGLRRMTMKLEAAKEQERKHLARELHDEFGQALTTAKINLGLALTQLPGAAGSRRIQDTVQVIDSLIGQVRALSLDLRPPLLDDLGLVPALESHLHAVSERSNIPIRANLDPQVELPDSDQRIAVFRIVQEAVTNALRHAQATALEVSVSRVADGTLIRVQDNGRGFDVHASATPRASGMGLFGMRERVHGLGGTISIESQPGHGTLIDARIPATGAADARDPG
jgi:signal transduction histidine kinase/ligand-binding sensor domain-containing protein